MTSRPTPYDEGQSDYDAGKKLSDNRYQRRSINYANWKAGWKDRKAVMDFLNNVKIVV